jgi:hypothetical protein
MGLIIEEILSKRLYKMLTLTLMSLLMIIQRWVMMNMTLHPWAKETNLGQIEQEGM